VSRSDRTTHAQSAPLHAAFKKANGTLQREMREQFITGFVADDLGISATAALKIVAQSRTDRKAAAQKSFNNARRQFDHHVRRGIELKNVAGKRKAGKRKVSADTKALNKIMASVVVSFASIKKATRKLSPANARKINAKLAALLREAKALAE
jgi:hypothetical protein